MAKRPGESGDQPAQQAKGDPVVSLVSVAQQVRDIKTNIAEIKQQLRSLNPVTPTILVTCMAIFFAIMGVVIGLLWSANSADLREVRTVVYRSEEKKETRYAEALARFHTTMDDVGKVYIRQVSSYESTTKATIDGFGKTVQQFQLRLQDVVIGLKDACAQSRKVGDSLEDTEVALREVQSQIAAVERRLGNIERRLPLER